MTDGPDGQPRVRRARRAHHFRRTALVAVPVACVIVAVLALPASSAPAEDAPVTVELPGAGNAIATAIKVNPTAAALSLGVSFGVALSGHQNGVSQAEARGIDLGIIGSTLTAEPCDGGDPSVSEDSIPHPVHADSRDPDAGAAKTGNDNGVATKSAMAIATPFAESFATVVPWTVPGVIDVGAGAVHTISGVINGNTRVAQAVSEVGSITLAGGLVKIAGLRWEATYMEGAQQEISGVFTIASASIAGSKLPTQDPSKALEQINNVTNLIGIKITPPAIQQAGGIQFVDPLSIGIVPNAQRDKIASQLFEVVQPVREPLFAELIKQDCSNASYILVADIAIGSVSGAGSFSVLLGGAQATTHNVRVGNYLGDYTPNPPPSVSVPSLPRPSFTPPTTPVVTAPPVSTTPTTREVAAPIVSKKSDGKRGGALAAVSAVGLIVLAAVAEGDRRKMRRAQRQILRV